MTKKILYALLATVISVGLWLYVVTVVNPEWEETFYNIPVVLENEKIMVDRGFMLAQGEAPKVTLRLSGSRTDMMKLNSSNITLIADLSRIYSAGEQTIAYSIIYPADVPSNAFEIVSQTPKQITLSIAQWKSKEVDVEIKHTGKLPEQYIAFKDEAVQEYNKITITGPATIVDQIKIAKVNVDLTNRIDTINQKFSYTLCDRYGNPVDATQIKTNVQEIQYTMKIQRWKDIELRLDVINGGGLKKEDCTIDISAPSIRVSGNDQALAELQFLLLDTINLGELMADFSNSYVITLPEGLTNLTEQNTITVTVDIPELPMREFVVSDILSTNVPDDMKVDIITKEKTITVRGPEELLNAMTAEDVFIEIDFTNAEIGTNPYKATVYVRDLMKDMVGVVGSYDIWVTVEKVADNAAAG